MPDTGVTDQARAMLDRVSPEGRARALKEQRRRQAATNKLILRCLLAGAIVAALTAAIAYAIPLGTPGILAALIVWAIACVAIAMGSREKPATSDSLAATRLHQLPDAASRWLAGQRPALPPPAIRVADDILHRLDGMTAQLARLDPKEPAADAVRKLLCVELPDLVTGYHAVPPSLRDRAGSGGQSADSHLVEGLGVIDAEVARMTEQLARGAFDEVATQRRYLELKYDGAGSLSS
ncbi:MAG TPA: hypothetical protein VF409_02595 [Sphingomonas sp.]